MAILVTGGAGYIGSHTCIELLNAGYEVVVMDNLYNASEEALRRVEKITGKHVTFYKADMLDREAVNEIFEKESIDSVIHFAGLKAVRGIRCEATGILPQQYHRNLDSLRRNAQSWRQENHFQFLRYRIRRSGIRPDHRRMPERQNHKPLRSDKGNA